MNLGLYFRVIWRFRLLVVCGVMVASLLSLLSVVRVDVGNGGALTYREQEQWVSYGRLFVTQVGFPWGRTIVTEGSQAEVTIDAIRRKVRLADPGRFSTLAILYAQLADSDAVRAIMLESGPINGTIESAPVLTSTSSNADALPLISIAAIADSPATAITLARRKIEALRIYIERQQESTNIPETERVTVSLLKRPQEAELYAGRSMTRAIVTFLTILMGVIGLAFVLENLRPRSPVLEGAEPAPTLDAVRRSA